MRLHFTSRLTAGMVLLGFLLCVGAPCLAEEPPTAPFELRNGQWISEHLLGGRSTRPVLSWTPCMPPASGRWSTLRGLSETEQLALEGFDEAKQAESLGLSYLHLPISGADDLDAEESPPSWPLGLENEDHLPALVHCASSNRVGALFALKSFYLDGREVGASLRIGP